jgi:hypothetical protein
MATMPFFIRCSVILMIIFTAFDVAFATQDPPNKCTASISAKSQFNVPYRVNDDGLIELKIDIKNPLLAKSLQNLARELYEPLSISELEKVTMRLVADTRIDVPFWLKLSEAFGQTNTYDNSILQGIPKTGPLVIVANHPLNGVEGIAIAALISRVRPDVKVALTPLLSGMPGIADNAIFVNPYGGRAAAEANISARNAMNKHVQSGGALLIFPSGEVSVRPDIAIARVTDNKWKTGVVKLLRQVPGANVLPIFVGGQTSFDFQLAKRVEQSLPQSLTSVRMILTTVMHIREVASRVGEDVELTVGRAISSEELLAVGNDIAVIEALRQITYGLGPR